MASITDTKGRTTTFSYSSSQGYLSSFQAPDGRTFTYTYNSSTGYLSTANDEAGATYAYGYDANHRLAQITNPDGYLTTVSYDSQGRVSQIVRVTDTTNNSGPTTTFFYGQGASKCSNTADTATQVQDPDGNLTTYCYDPNDTQEKVVQVIDARGYSRSVGYTSDANVKTYTNATSSSPYNLAYNTANDPTSVTAPTGAQSTLSYNAGSSHPYSPDSVTDAQKNTTNYTYDSSWNQTSTSNGSSTAHTDYNGDGSSQACTSVTTDTGPAGTVRCVKDARGNETVYHYNGTGDLVEVDPPSPLGKITLGYDGASRLSSVTYGNGTSATYSYDPQDRITKITYGDGTTVTYSYDGDGNMLTRTDRSGRSTTYTYDALDREKTKTGPGSDSSSYTYDNASNLSTITDASGTVTYQYNPDNLVKQITDPNGSSSTFSYDNDDNLTTVTYPNSAVTITNGYDASDRLKSILAKNSAGTTLENRTYSYNDPNNGNQDSSLWWQDVDNLNNLTTNYTYDNLNRLTAANQTGAQTASYSYGYDSNGNLTNYNGTSFTYNAANEISSSGYSYDGAGNETAGGVFSYSYNPANQTTSITQNSNTQAITYADAGQSEVTNIGSTALTNTVLGVSSTSDSTGSYYYTRTPTGGLVDERTPSGTYYYIFDGLGSVVALTDANGNLADTYGYDPYGRLLPPSGTNTVKNVWRYDGEYNLDPVLQINHIGQRYYNTSTGSWTQQDPASHIGDLSQADPFTYVGDDPVNETDPQGTGFLSSIGAGAVLGAIGGAIEGSPLGFVGAAAGAAVGAVEGAVEGAAGYGLTQLGVPQNVVNTTEIGISSLQVAGGFVKKLADAIENF